jgi:hypothetical protein
MHPYLLPLVSLFKEHADPVQAAPLHSLSRREAMKHLE